MRSCSLKALFASAALLLASVQAEVTTDTFGSHLYHEIPTLGKATTASLIIGWIFITFFTLLICGLVVQEAIQRHKNYCFELDGAKRRLKELGGNVGEAEREYAAMIRGERTQVYAAGDDDHKA